jgi:hypothetical protein
MKCQKCEEQIDLTALEVRNENTVERAGEPEIEVGLRCKCGADYAFFVSVKDLVLMD